MHHALGFVPMTWVRNLPGGDDTDGACTFRAAIETAIEIDYQLSQAGRGLKYSSDPTLLIKEPVGAEGEMVKGAGNALVVSEKGDARLLEIGGTAASAVIDYVRTLREFTLESVHGNRADASKLSAATSGRALELMNQGLVWLADNLRVSYGEGALLALARMVLRARARYPIKVMGETLPAFDANARLGLKWPRWYPLSAQDRLADAQTLQTLVRRPGSSRARPRRLARRHLRHRRHHRRDAAHRGHVRGRHDRGRNRIERPGRGRQHRGWDLRMSETDTRTETPPGGHGRDPAQPRRRSRAPARRGPAPA